MKVLLLLARGFETMEFSVFVDVLGWARNDFGCDVTVETLDQVNTMNYDALAIPGGFEEFGFYEDSYDERFLNIIRDFNLQGKIIATICVAALPLGKSGILKNRLATTYHLRGGYRQKQLADFQVNVVNEPIVVDNNIITSYCPQTAPDVAFKLLELLTSKEKMEEVKEAMGF